MTIDNSEENQIVRNLSNRSFWIGLYENSQREFVWVRNSTSPFLNWAPGEPNNKESVNYTSCVHMKGSSLYWNDRICKRTASYVCEKGQDYLVVQRFSDTDS